MLPPTGVVWLQQAPPSQDYSFFIMMGAIFLIFYMLIIRPQQRRQKDHETMLKAVEKGDEVVTSGGLHGKVTGTTDDVLTLEIAALKSGDRVRVKVQRSRVESSNRSGADKGKSESKGASS